MDKTLKQNVTYENCYPRTGEKCSAARETCPELTAAGASGRVLAPRQEWGPDG